MTIYIPLSDIEKRNQIMLSTDKSHYLLNVMRCKTGEIISVIDGNGRAFQAEIQSIRSGSVFLNILGEMTTDTESPFNLILCQGIIKGEKMDVVIQKATELGIKQIIPMITERVVVKKTRKLKRWKKIAEETAEQCGRTVIPIIHEPVEIRKFLMQINSAIVQRQKGLIFWEEGGESLAEALKEITSCETSRNALINNIPFYIAIGPEGGLTYQEVRLAEDIGFIKTTLGKRILKSETAAIVSIALIHFLLELHRE